MATKQAKGQKIGRGSRSNSSKQQKVRSERNKTRAIEAERKKGNKTAGVSMTPDQYKVNWAKRDARQAAKKKADEKLIAMIHENARRTKSERLHA